MGAATTIAIAKSVIEPLAPAWAVAPRITAAIRPPVAFAAALGAVGLASGRPEALVAGGGAAKK